MAVKSTVETLKDRIEKLINDAASGIADPEVEIEQAANGKVGGFVISPTFAGKAQLDRQNMLWDYLDRNLEKEEILRIVSLVTLTPDEASED